MAPTRTRLVPDDPTDPDCTNFIAELHPAAWISVDQFSVYLRRTHEGLVVDIYPRGREDAQPLASTYAFTHDAVGQDTATAVTP